MIQSVDITSLNKYGTAYHVAIFSGPIEALRNTSTTNIDYKARISFRN